MMRAGGALRKICLVAGLAMAWPAGGWADTTGDPRGLPVEEIETIVREYLMREPEVLYEALQELQRRQAEAVAERQRAAIAENHSELFENAATPVGGNPDGDVTLVEFFDYRCAYCRRVVSSMRALMEEDPELRVVFKELPVLGADSVRAAKAALASRKQDKYLPFHFALMTSNDLSLEGIRSTAEVVGLDPDQLEADMAAPEIIEQIERNYALAGQLGIEGTPAFVIGSELVPGAVDKVQLEQLIEAERSG